MEFSFDEWYVAGWSRNFQHELVPQTILEQNLVFPAKQQQISCLGRPLSAPAFAAE